MSGGFAASSGPLQPIAVVGTVGPLHFGKATEDRFPMVGKPNPAVLTQASGKSPVSVVEGMAVLTINPSPPFLRMPTTLSIDFCRVEILRNS